MMMYSFQYFELGTERPDSYYDIYIAISLASILYKILVANNISDCSVKTCSWFYQRVGRLSM